MKKYIDTKKNTYQLDKLKPTGQVKNTFFEMIKDISVRIYYSPIRVWGRAANAKGAITGAWLVRVSHNQSFTSLIKTHGRAINALFDCGVVEVDETLSTSKWTVFKLCKEAIDDSGAISSKLKFDDRRRVQWEELNALAEVNGIKIEFQSIRQLFKLTKLDGSSFREDEYVLFNSRDMAVNKLNDMTWLEWETLFNECRVMIEAELQTR